MTVLVHHHRAARWLVVVLVAVTIGGCAPPAVPGVPTAAPVAVPAGFSPAELGAVLGLSPLPAPPDDPTNRYAADPRAARLGRWLFFDERLSRSGTVACASCHDPKQGWGDGRALAVGEGQVTRHAMTLWNVAYNRWFFWDGRADSLWSQALGPLEEPAEHGSTRLEIAHLLASDPALRAAYEDLFGSLPPLGEVARFPARGRPIPNEPRHPDARAYAAMDPTDRHAVDVVFANVGKALAAFQRRIVSRRSRFDIWAEGVAEGDPQKLAAMTAAEQRGLQLFVGKAKCMTCHSGPLFSDREFHDTRVPPRKGGKRVDPGRQAGIDRVLADPFNGVGAFSDASTGAARDKVGYLVKTNHSWSEFKTPSLRNVARTAPYMHQGQFGTLAEVLQYYNTLEGAVRRHHAAESVLAPLGLSPEELQALEAFLGALSDEDVLSELQTPPTSPGSLVARGG
ncbi:MAG: cytochrome c peroxidase [Planctomycetota bacterium]